MHVDSHVGGHSSGGCLVSIAALSSEALLVRDETTRAAALGSNWLSCEKGGPEKVTMPTRGASASVASNANLLTKSFMKALTSGKRELTEADPSATRMTSLLEAHLMGVGGW